MKNARTTKASVLVALVHELVKGEPFETLGDLAEAVKCRAARLRIPYDSGHVSAAIDAVAHTRPVLQTPARPDSQTLRSSMPEPSVSRAEAVAILRDLGVRR